jgi:dihydrodipicolinate reductase
VPRGPVHVALFGERVQGAGLGRFATALKDSFATAPDINLSIAPTAASADVAVYASRDPGQLPAAFDVCDGHKGTLLVVATGIEQSVAACESSVPVVMASNTSLEVLDAIKQVVATRKRLPNHTVQIIEAHQTTKQDVSGTALTVARLIGAMPSDIVSIRDDEYAAQAYDISPESLGGYAIHDVVFTDVKTGEEAHVQWQMEGHDSYAAGAVAIVRMIRSPDFRAWQAGRPHVDFTDYYLQQM